jgi:hypothetical protein
VQTVTAPVTPIVQTVTAPVTPIVQTVTAPITPIVETVTAPITPIVETFTNATSATVNTVLPITTLTAPAAAAVAPLAPPTTQSASNTNVPIVDAPSAHTSAITQTAAIAPTTVDATVPPPVTLDQPAADNALRSPSFTTNAPALVRATHGDTPAQMRTLSSSSQPSPPRATTWPPRSAATSPLSSIPAAAGGIALVVAILAAHLALPSLRRNGLVPLVDTSWRQSTFVDVLARPG